MKRETTCNSFRTSALNGVKTELYNLTNVHFYTANKYTYRDKCISYKLINITLQLELCADFIVSAKARRSIIFWSAVVRRVHHLSLRRGV